MAQVRQGKDTTVGTTALGIQRLAEVEDLVPLEAPVQEQPEAQAAQGLAVQLQGQQ